MAKYSAGPTMVINWTPSGSTTVTALSANARGVAVNESIDSADATGYGNSNRQHVPTISDLEIPLEYLLDDTTYTAEDLLTIGARGTIDIYPNGNSTGKKKISVPVFVSSRDRDFPFDDVAVASHTLMPTGNKTESTVA